MHRVALAMLLIITGLLSADGALADGGAKLVLCTAGRDAPFGRRLRAELEALRFEVQPLPPPVESESLSELAQSHHADATILVERGADGLRVIVARAGNVRDELFELAIAPSGQSEELLALRAVELVRARLLEIEEQHRETPSAQPSEPSAPDVEPGLRHSTARPTSRFGIGLAAGAVFATDQAIPSGALSLNLAIRAHPLVWVETSLVVPALAGTVRSTDGRTDVRPWILGAGLRFELLPPTSPFALAVRGGIAGLALRLDGTAQAPLEGRADTVWAVVPEVGAAISWRLTPHLKLFAASAVMITLPRVSIRFDNQEVASWGRPLVIPALGVQLEL